MPGKKRIDVGSLIFEAKKNIIMHTEISIRLHRILMLTLLPLAVLGPQKLPAQEVPIPENTTVAYFSTIALRESPYPDFRGVIRMTRDQAMKRNHYRLIYDKNFRLASVSFHLGNTLREPNHTANYFFTTPVQKIHYEKGKEIRSFFDRFGNQVTQRGVFREIYMINEMGKRVALHYENENGKKMENSWGISDYKWEHQMDGSVIEKRFNLEQEPKSLRPGFEFFTIRLYYEQNGLLALMQNIDEYGNLVENSSGVAQDKLLFDEAGRWYGWNVLDKNHQIKRGNGPNVAKGINIPNEYGYETSVRYEDTDGSPLKNNYGFWGSHRFYDAFGNYDYTQFIDSTGKPGLNSRSGYCYAQYTWDRSGLNRLKVELLDTEKKAVLHKRGGYATIQQEYDQENKLIKTSYLGLDGKLVNRKDNGVAYIIYHYDEKRKRVKQIRFDRQGISLE